MLNPEYFTESANIVGIREMSFTYEEFVVNFLY